MAKVRVSTLAKEFGMTSKELMGHLADMKIPAKSASSTLEDAYVAMVRKQLASVIGVQFCALQSTPIFVQPQPVELNIVPSPRSLKLSQHVSMELLASLPPTRISPLEQSSFWL